MRNVVFFASKFCFIDSVGVDIVITVFTFSSPGDWYSFHFFFLLWHKHAYGLYVGFLIFIHYYSLWYVIFVKLTCVEWYIGYPEADRTLVYHYILCTVANFIMLLLRRTPFFKSFFKTVFIFWIQYKVK